MADAYDSRFSYEHTVQTDSIDQFRHVNNLEYLRWVLEAATRHSEHRGWDMARYQKAGGGWVIRRHEIDYKRQVLAGDRLQITTWVESYTRVTALRCTELRNVEGEVVCACKTTWVFFTLANMRPARIPEELRRDFGGESATGAG